MASKAKLEQTMMKAVQLAQAGKLKQAIPLMETVVAGSPGDLAARYNLALMLLEAGGIPKALAHLDHILSKNPSHAPSLYSKAKALLALGKPGEALPILQDLSKSNDPDCLMALANTLRQLGRFSDAVSVGQSMPPGFLPGQLNHGQLLMEIDPQQAADFLEKTLRLHHSSPELTALLGQALLRLGKAEQGIPHLCRALSLKPSLMAAQGHLLRAYRECAKWSEEEETFALIRKNLGALLARTDQLAIPTQDALFFDFSGDELRQIAQAEAKFRVPHYVARTLPKSGKLTIGYLSPDYREHATMNLAGELFAAHDRKRFQIFAYSTGPDDGSEWRSKIARDCDKFIDLAGLTDAQAAQRIEADGVQILVDMSVYTRHARPGIAALRPAPVQIAWLGLAASSGAPWFDAMLVDDVLVPPEHRGHFTETLISLPGCYQPSQSWQPLRPTPSRQSLGLPEGAMVYCSFNGHRKQDRASVTVWLNILTQVSNSVLWLLAPPPPAQHAITELALSLGIEPDRIVWAPPLPRNQHLARMGAADLFLDAVVCGAHTTAADAVRTGVPLLTIAGKRLASRVAASVLTTHGFNDLICADIHSFTEKAVSFGLDQSLFNSVQVRFRSAVPTSPLFDTLIFAAKLERTYEKLVDQ